MLLEYSGVGHCIFLQVASQLDIFDNEASSS